MTTNNQGVGTRELALMILLEIERGEKSHIVLRQVLEKYQYLSKQDRAFLTRLAEGTTERRIELDYIINQFSKVKTEKMKPVIRNILRCAVYQIMKLPVTDTLTFFLHKIMNISKEHIKSKISCPHQYQLSPTSFPNKIYPQFKGLPNVMIHFAGAK